MESRARVPVLSTRTLNRTLLLRQQLLERTDRAPLEVVEHLVGMQAQLPDNPYLGLWSRVAAFDPALLAADILGRRAVRMALMRSTIHLVSVDDAIALRPVVQEVLDRELFGNRTWSTGLEGLELEPVLAHGRRLVEARPMAVHELRAAMAERWPDHDAATLAYAVRNLLPTFQPPPRGVWGRTGRPTLTTLDTWAGRPMATDANPDRVILRYLAAFGPATVADLQAWSRLQGLREPVERLRPHLRTFRDERARELLDVPDAPIADGDIPAPVRFLPDYDNVLLGHADRGRIMPPSTLAEIRARIGRPAFLVDGFVAGLWRQAGPRSAPSLELEPLRTLSDGERAAVEAEGAGVLAFLATARPGARRPTAVGIRWVP